MAAPLPSQQDDSNYQQQQAAAELDLSVVLVTAGYDHTVKFWEAWSGICARTIDFKDQKQITKLAISPDKKLLAAAGYTTVRLYDITNPANATPITTLEGHTGNITSVAFQNEGKWIVTGSEDSTVKIWDTKTGSIQRNYAHGSPVNDVIIHPNQGELVSCDQAGSVKVWDLGENSCTHELVPNEDVPMRSVTIASDGSCLIAGNNRGDCYVWNFAEGGGGVTDLHPVTTFKAHQGYVTRVLLSPDVKRLATCSSDKTVRIWSTENHSYGLEMELKGHQRWVWDACFSADSAYLVTASSDHKARLWDLNSGQTVREYTGHQRAVVTVALNDINLG